MPSSTTAANQGANPESAGTTMQTPKKVRRLDNTPVARQYMLKQETLLKKLLHHEKPKTSGVLASLAEGRDQKSIPTFHTFDYEDAWGAVGTMMDKRGDNWQQDMRLEEQRDINQKYDSVRAEQMFDHIQPTSTRTKLLDNWNTGSGHRRTKSQPPTSHHTRSKVSGNDNDTQQLTTIIVNTGVNWVCPANPNNQGLNATCMQPSAKSALTFLKPADDANAMNFIVQGCDTITRTDVLRDKVQDKKGKLFDEKKIYYIEKSSGKTISPWHDISLICHSPPDHISKSHGLLVNMVVEIPRFNSAKMEISTTRTHNPIIQDRCKALNRDRFYAGPIPWNYGALPQTWEDPDHAGDGEVNNALGDGDPLDVVDVGRSPSRGEFKVGEVVPVRVLGCVPMLDGGDELDWKVLAINCYDKHFDQIHDLYSLGQIYPHSLTGIREWFRWYKFNDSEAKLNDFGYNGLVICRCGAEDIVKATHLMWRELMAHTCELGRNMTNKMLRDDEGDTESYHHVRLNKQFDFGKDFTYNVWAPAHLRPGTKAWKDRNVIYQGSLARNAGREGVQKEFMDKVEAMNQHQHTPIY